MLSAVLHGRGDIFLAFEAMLGNSSYHRSLKNRIHACEESGPRPPATF